MASIIVIVILFGMIFHFFGRSKFSFSEKTVESEDHPEYSLDRLTVQLDSVNNLVDQIQNIETLITDIEVCEPTEYIKNVTLSWFSDADNRNCSYSFFVDGENLNSQMFLNMAYAEREKLRSLLPNEIDNLKERSYENCYDNYVKIKRGVK